MIKKLIFTCVVLLLLVVGGAFFYLDSLVKNGIEIAGSQVLGTTVTVDSVSISPINGTGSIAGLKIRNPEDFSSEYAIELGSIAVNLDVGSLLSDTIQIDSVIISNPEVTYENRITTDNIRALLNNLSGDSDEAGAAPNASEGASTGVVIVDLLMVDPQVNVVAALITAPISLPDVHLENIGEEGDSVSFPEASRRVLAALSDSILSANLPDIGELTENIEEKLEEGVQQIEDAVGDTVDDLGNRLRDIF